MIRVLCLGSAHISIKVFLAVEALEHRLFCDEFLIARHHEESAGHHRSEQSTNVRQVVREVDLSPSSH